MSPETVRALREINLRFYRTRAARFGARREHPWPGFERILERIDPSRGPVLDVGCGNGRFGAALARLHPGAGWVGVDASAAFLAHCHKRGDLPAASSLVELDALEQPASLPPGPFGAVVALGLLHHVPSEPGRRHLLGALADRVGPGGLLAVTLWRFGCFERFRRLELSWAGTGVDPTDLEPGDRLLSFEGEGAVPRYCHFADAAETQRLAVSLALPLVDRFRADGREGVLNEYLVWERPA